MPKALAIQHVTLITDNLEETCTFYEQEFGLEPLPTFNLDFPAQFYRINDKQQLHISEFPDKPSFRGHVCLHVDDFNHFFRRMKELGAIDTTPWGRVRQLPDGTMQMFVRDPAGNLVEISCPPGAFIDEDLFVDELVEPKGSIYVSGRNEGRGVLRSDNATLYHDQNES